MAAHGPPSSFRQLKKKAPRRVPADWVPPTLAPNEVEQDPRLSPPVMDLSDDPSDGESSPVIFNKKARLDPVAEELENPYHLPPDTPARIQDLYSSLAFSDRGPALLYYKHFCETVKTSGDEDIWIFDDAPALWRRTSLRKWQMQVGDFLANKVSELLKWLRKEVSSAEAFGDKDNTKTWRAFYGRADAAAKRLGSGTGQREIASLAFERLRDEDFVKTLDSNRRILSVSNGVIHFRKEGDGAWNAHLRERTIEDALSYALPFRIEGDYDTSSIERLVHNLYEDKEAELAFQTLCGYLATGEATEKAFYQIAAPRHSGKTTFFQVLANALGDYVALNTVPISELTSSDFGGTLANALCAHPPPRIIVCDEISEGKGDGGIELNEVIINNLCSGKNTARLTMDKKHKEGVFIQNPQAKLVLLTNHFLRARSSATGLVARIRGIGLRFTFDPDYPADGVGAHPLSRPRDAELEALLMSDEQRPCILMWVIKGILRYLAGESMTCARFDDSTFELHVKGDLYFEWIVTHYTPTGSTTDTVPFNTLMTDFKAEGRSPFINGGAHKGLTAVLKTMRDYIELSTRPVAGFSVTSQPKDMRDFAAAGAGAPPATELVVEGIRPRRPDDVNWVTARKAARDLRMIARQGEA